MRLILSSTCPEQREQQTKTTPDQRAVQKRALISHLTQTSTTGELQFLSTPLRRCSQEPPSLIMHFKYQSRFAVLQQNMLQNGIFHNFHNFHNSHNIHNIHNFFHLPSFYETPRSKRRCCLSKKQWRRISDHASTPLAPFQQHSSCRGPLHPF